MHGFRHCHLTVSATLALSLSSQHIAAQHKLYLKTLTITPATQTQPWTSALYVSLIVVVIYDDYRPIMPVPAPRGCRGGHWCSRAGRPQPPLWQCPPARPR